MPSLVTRPSKCSNRCISAGLEILISLWFTIILNDRKGIKKKFEKTKPTWWLVCPPDRASYSIQFCWKWLSKTQFSYQIIQKFYSVQKGTFILQFRTRHGNWWHGWCQAKFVFKRNIRKGYRFISNTRRTGSQSNNKLAWRKWVSCCHRKQSDSFSNHLRDVLDFLAEMFELGFEYSTINIHGSGMSVFHKPIEGFSVEKHSKVWDLMTSVYNKRPPKPILVGVGYWNNLEIFKITSKICWYKH